MPTSGIEDMKHLILHRFAASSLSTLYGSVPKSIYNTCESKDDDIFQLDDLFQLCYGNIGNIRI
jgi:hypothetical protein